MKKSLFFIFIVACIFLLYASVIEKSNMTMVMFDMNEKVGQKINENIDNENSTYIKWMEFDVPLEVMQQALKYDILSYNKEIPLDWIELISYGAAKNWGEFQKGVICKDIDELVLKLQNGEKISDLTKDLKLYDFYLQSYRAVLGGFVGEFEICENDTNNPAEKKYIKKYGLKVFSPIPKGFSFSHYDDFGDSRSYGYKRRHLGNDLMGNVGTPIVAVEDGYVEVMGWNQFGGWRIGIRSYDKKRYYYYAHLKKDHPFVSTLKEGDHVQAGDVIGYLGMTGYSTKENVNNIKRPHLHFGMQIIFDESQKESSNQIWVDVYEIINLLNKNRMDVKKNTETKEHIRDIQINTIINE